MVDLQCFDFSLFVSRKGAMLLFIDNLPLTFILLLMAFILFVVQMLSFRSVLGFQHTWEEGIKIPHIFPNSPIIYITHQSGFFFFFYQSLSYIKTEAQT